MPGDVVYAQSDVLATLDGKRSAFLEFINNSVMGSQFSRYKTPEDVLASSEEELCSYIRTITFFQAKARHIVFCTRAVRQITILKQRHKLALELQVVDDGPGVPEEIQDRIFNPLVSGREGGTGLGLSLAQTFVQYHQGVIEFESRPGRTTFRILLPLT